MARIKPQALLLQSKKKKGPSRISVTTIILISLIAVIMLLFLFSSYKYWSQRSKIQDVESSILEGDSNIENVKSSDLPRYGVLRTSKGLITVELLGEGSPNVVDEFIELCQRGHFKGMPIQRVIKNFVVQGGNVDGHKAAEDWLLMGKHTIPLDTSMKYEAFMLATSKDKHDKKEFELFITTAPLSGLSEKLIVFGRVIKGEDVVQEIEKVDTDEHYRPKSSIVITDITLKQKV